jgi:hypothetical protein
MYHIQHGSRDYRRYQKGKEEQTHHCDKQFIDDRCQFLYSFQCNSHAIRKIANQFIITMIVNVFDRLNTSRKKHATTNDTGIMCNIGGTSIT